ncbi:BA75_02500T0 [Komagataella pastoris]|uniref:BA75_02500T0 n=1 Tax=Komagataella pastoris TaxID=4922 RepID=A0A1B2JCX5_PICPA|nr:BA75_02500T0 [Komagataella pastoris]
MERAKLVSKSLRGVTRLCSLNSYPELWTWNENPTHLPRILIPWSLKIHRPLAQPFKKDNNHVTFHHVGSLFFFRVTLSSDNSIAYIYHRGLSSLESCTQS